MTGAAMAADSRATTTFADRRLAMLLMTLFAVTWAVLENELGVRLRQPYALTQIVWCRYASHLLIVASIWGWRTPSQLWRTSRPALQLGRSLLMLVMPLSFGLAIASGAAPASAWAVFWIAPLCIVLLAKLVTRERVPAWIWCATAIGSVGAVAIIDPRGIPRGIALLWPMLMAGSFSLYVVLTRVLRREPLSANLFYTAIGVFIPLSFVMPRVWVQPSLHDAVILFAIGALGFVALLALDRAAERAEVPFTAAFLTLQVATVLLIGWARQTAVLGIAALVGLALIVVSLSVVWVLGPRVRTPTVDRVVAP